MLYLEVLYNLLLCRYGEHSHPPMLLAVREMWARPTTPSLLAQLLDVKQVGVVTVPYLMLSTYERLFAYSWIELLPVRLSGADVSLMRELGDKFAEAELALRKSLFTPKGQELIAKALAENLERLQTQPKKILVKVGLRDRYRNASGSIPLGAKLGTPLTIMAWQVYKLMSSDSPRGCDRRHGKSRARLLLRPWLSR